VIEWIIVTRYDPPSQSWLGMTHHSISIGWQVCGCIIMIFNYLLRKQGEFVGKEMEYFKVVWISILNSFLNIEPTIVRL
jgi:hypothetical protein